MHQVVKARQLLSEQQVREVNAALALRGHDQKSFAAHRKLSYDRFNKMLSKSAVVTGKYVDELNELLTKTKWPKPTAVAA